MTDLRAAAQQALEALEKYRKMMFVEAGCRFGEGDAAITNLRAALAQQAEPVARECSDPMCACRGGPCAECEEGERGKEIEDLRSSLYFYQRRCEALQSWQSKMRDPERTIVCDILANGKTLDSAVAGDRYTAPPQRVAQQDEPVQEPIRLDCSSPLVVHPHPAFQTTPPKAEPVAWEGWWLHHGQHNYRAKPLTSERVKELMKLAFEVGRESTPPQREPLTEEEIYRATRHCGVSKYTAVNITRAVERAVWEKNHG